MKRIGCLLGLLLLVGCTTSPMRPPVRQISTVVRQCRAGPNGGPVLADRGIGGTGIGISDDRGIGGTGVDNLGVVGVVTGFASICVDGTEIAYGDATTVLIDGKPASPDALRVGQLVALRAATPSAGLRTDLVTVRHAVIGPVRAIQQASTVLDVAGQRVILDTKVPGADHLSVGDWIAVSGLVGPGGAVHATRVDPAPAGEMLVRGTLNGTARMPRIGLLHLRWASGLRVPSPGTKVTVVGHDVDGVLLVGRVSRDLLASDPPAYFGPTTHRYLMEGFVTSFGGRIRFDDGWNLPAGQYDQLLNGPSMRAVLSLRRTPGGRMALTGLNSPEQSLGPQNNRRAFAPVMGGPANAARSPGAERSQRGQGGQGPDSLPSAGRNGIPGWDLGSGAGSGPGRDVEGPPPGMHGIR